MAEAYSHSDLVRMAEKWLQRQGCGVVFRDAFRARTDHGEQPDAIGWRNGPSILVECKATRGDFLADRRKPFRCDPEKGVGDWRFYLCPTGMISAAELSPGWGLLYANGDRVKAVHGVPGNTGWWRERPFKANRECEAQMLYSALRRIVIRGHFESIYEPLLTGAI